MINSSCLMCALEKNKKQHGRLFGIGVYTKKYGNFIIVSLNLTTI